MTKLEQKTSASHAIYLLEQAVEPLMDAINAAQSDDVGVADPVIEEYARFRKAAAAAIHELARARWGGSKNISETKTKVQAEMTRRFGELLPARLLKVAGYNETHEMLYAYLSRSAGKSVAGSDLKMITGEQANTERRIRDLRDLGYSISVYMSSGEAYYTLESTTPDLASATAAQLRHSIKGDKTLSASLARDYETIVSGSGSR